MSRLQALIAQTAATETVVRNHLRAFVERRGVAAILEDYDPDARLYGEAAAYHGKEQIRGFFVDFIASLPPGAIERFTLNSLRVHKDLAFITWTTGRDIPLGTDTFVVRDGKIVMQTFAMHAAREAAPPHMSRQSG